VLPLPTREPKAAKGWKTTTTTTTVKNKLSQVKPSCNRWGWRRLVSKPKKAGNVASYCSCCRCCRFCNRQQIGCISFFDCLTCNWHWRRTDETNGRTDRRTDRRPAHSFLGGCRDSPKRKNHKKLKERLKKNLKMPKFQYSKKAHNFNSTPKMQYI